MNEEPATMVIWDPDEERTLVDQARHARPASALRGSGPTPPPRSPSTPDEHSQRQAEPSWRSASTLLSSHRRQVIEFSLAFAVLVGLGSVAQQQSQVVEALRVTLTELGAPRPTSDSAQSRAFEQSRETPQPADLQRRAAAREIAAEEREEMERHAAALIAANDFPAALKQYQALAELFPREATFRDFVAVLRAKLRCDRADRSASSACP